jgi:hypothetical protein
MTNYYCKSTVSPHDGLGCQVETQVGGIVFSKLFLILQFVFGELVYLHILYILLSSSVPFCIVGIVVFRIALEAIVRM